MAIYSLAQRTSNTTNGQAAMDCAAASTGVRPRIMEWQVFMGAATPSVYGLNRASALGTRTTPVALLPEDERDPALTGITLVDSATAHSVQPTLATNYLRRMALQGVVGAGLIWVFPKGIVISGVSPVSSLVLVNLGTNGVVDSTVIADI